MRGVIGRAGDSALGWMREFCVRDLILGADAPSARVHYSRAMRWLINVALDHVDVTIAMALLALGLVEALAVAEAAPIWLQVPLTFVWTVPLIWRRRWPVAVLALVIVMGPTLSLVNPQGGVSSFVLSAMLAAYTVGRELDTPKTWWGPALTVGFGWVVYGATGGALSDFVFVALLYGGAWAVGYTIRRRAVEVDELSRETDELRRTHAERERRAVEAERARIARELHDIVSHNISVITIQSQAVRRRLESSNSDEAEILRAIETTARQAMAEMRHLLGVLRADGNAPPLAPQPGIGELPLLLAEVHAAGVEVNLIVEGDPVSVTPGVALACYRVIQEGLTNVRKHSLAGSAEVLLRYRPEMLEIQIDDAGPGQPAASSEDGLSGGHGLAGMRERVTLYRGRVDAGPLPDGGFRVHACLPLSDAGVLSA
jgi:signal transduction histidine kinase